MKPIITLNRVTKIFDEATPHRLISLQDISLEIIAGEFFIFAGPSGCGKSTLLRMMSGLDHDFRGTITIGGGLGQQDFGFVFQQFALLPWLTVWENVALGPLARNIPRHQAKRIAEKELKLLGLEKFASVHPHELSGGMRQRAGIARALATEPKIIFMDEPFSELDSFTAVILRKEILSVWQKRKPTIVMVTHLIPEAIELADRIAIMTPRPGKIEKIIHNPLPRPRNHHAAPFFKLEEELFNLIKP